MDLYKTWYNYRQALKNAPETSTEYSEAAMVTLLTKLREPTWVELNSGDQKG